MLFTFTKMLPGVTNMLSTVTGGKCSRQNAFAGHEEASSVAGILLTDAACFTCPITGDA